MSFFKYAKEGEGSLMNHPAFAKAPHRSHAHPLARPGHPVVGWTTPTTIYERMRTIDSSAREMNALILANVTRDTFKASWSTWLARWNVFFEKYQGFFAKLGAPFYTDELSRTVEDYRSGLAAFQRGYGAERDAKGEPLPPPVAALPEPLTGPDKKSESSVFPWWGWALVGVGTVGVGFFLYKRYVAVSSDLAYKRKALERILPSIMEKEMGPMGRQLGEAAASRDPNRLQPIALDPSTLDALRDPPPSPAAERPRSIFAMSKAPQDE